MAYATDLKKYLPESQRNSTSLNEFMDAVGELLDGFKTAIDDIQNYNDFHLIEEKNLDNLAKQFDIDFPRNMSVKRKREYLREIITLYRSKGTTNSLKRVFRIIGWDVEIDEYWIVNPDWYVLPTDNYILTNEQGQTQSLGLYETIIGNVKSYKNDKIYIDLVDGTGNIYPSRQIYGEPYKVDDDANFVKVPYIRINVKSEDFDLFTSDYVEDGNIYSYDGSEEFEILTSIKDYMIDRIRPATVAILEISTPFSLSDTITYTITENSGYAIFSGSSELTFNESSIPQTINRADGSWIDDGFENEATINIAGTLYDGSYKVRNVTAGNLTLYREQPLLKNPELLTNNMFDLGVIGWGGTNSLLSNRGNTLHVESVAIGISNAYQQISTVVGESYEFSAELISSGLTGDSSINIGTTIGGADVGYIPITGSTKGFYSSIFVSTATTLYFSLVSSSSQLAGESFGWDNASVKLSSNNLVGNGTFDSDIQWTKGAGWSISGGVATHTVTSSDLYQSLNLTVGQAYYYTVTVSGMTSEYVQPKLAGGSAVYGARIYSDGTYSGTLIAKSGNTIFSLASSVNFDGSIDNVSLVKVDEIIVNGEFNVGISDWTDISTGTGSIAWNASGYIDLTSVDGSNQGKAEQIITTIIGQGYRISYDHIDADLFSIYAGTTSENNDLGFDSTVITGSDYFEFIATSTTTYITLLGPTTATTSTVDNVSVVPINNIVSNGTFIEDYAWTKGTGWTIASGIATHAAGTASFLTQSINFVAGKKYVMKYEISGRTAGGIQMNIQGTAGSYRSADGTYFEVLDSIITTGNVEFSADAAFDGSIDNVQVVEVIETITDYYFNNNTTNAGAKYDGTITYGITTDRYLLGESMGGFKYGTTDMEYYGVDEDAPAQSLSRTYTNNGINIDQTPIAIRNHSEVVFEIDHASEIVSVYGVSNDRFSYVAGDPLITTAILINESTIGIHSVDVTGYTYVFVRTTFDAGQSITVTYNLF